MMRRHGSSGASAAARASAAADARVAAAPAVASLAEWRPSAVEPWDGEAAAHLLRRAGFRPSLGEIAAAVERGHGETVDRLLDGRPILENAERSARSQALARLAGTVAISEDIGRLRQWWLMRLVATDAPLHARLTLMWHDHFAVSNVKVMSAPLMQRHLALLEQHALGDFGALCRSIARDPAMIAWLDGNRNVNGRANENFARELLELFMLGLGAYTERDVREAARAFTGWHQRSGRFHFARLLHDDGEKSVLGRSGRLDGDDVIAAALASPACGRFLGGRLARLLVHPEPGEALVDAIAARLRETDYDVGATVGTILRSRAFMARPNRRMIIATPAEQVAGLARGFELPTVAGPVLERATNAMGQRLLEPPTVDGWPTQRGWLDPSRLLARIDAARRAVAPELLDAGAMRRRHGLRRRGDVLEAARRLTVGDAAHPDVDAALETAARTAGDDLDRLLHHALDGLVVLPEDQFL